MTAGWRSACVTATAVVLALAGCARERVDVADIAADPEPVRPDAGEPLPPSFDVSDGGLSGRDQSDAGDCTTDEPTVGVCAPCPTGYVIVDGEPTCTCCDG